MTRIIRDHAALNGLVTSIAGVKASVQGADARLANAVAPTYRGDVPSWGSIDVLTRGIRSQLKSIAGDLDDVRGQIRAYATRSARIERLLTASGMLGPLSRLPRLFLNTRYRLNLALLRHGGQWSRRVGVTFRGTDAPRAVQYGWRMTLAKRGARTQASRQAALNWSARTGGMRTVMRRFDIAATAASASYNLWEGGVAFRAGDYGTAAHSTVSAGTDVGKSFGPVAYGYSGSIQTMANTINNSRGRWDGTFSASTYTGDAATQVWLSPKSWAKSAWSSRGEIADNLSGFLPW